MQRSSSLLLSSPLLKTEPSLLSIVSADWTKIAPVLIYIGRCLPYQELQGRVTYKVIRNNNCHNETIIAIMHPTLVSWFLLFLQLWIYTTPILMHSLWHILCAVLCPDLSELPSHWAEINMRFSLYRTIALCHLDTNSYRIKLTLKNHLEFRSSSSISLIQRIYVRNATSSVQKVQVIEIKLAIYLINVQYPLIKFTFT